MKTSKPLLTLRMLFPAAASFIVLLLGEWIARGSLTADTFISFIFPHFGAYLLAWLLLFLVWLLLDWVFRCPPLSTLGMAVLLLVTDHVLGYQGWSVNYGIPSIILFADIAIVFLILVNRMNWQSYFMYQIAITLFSFIPIALWAAGFITQPVMAIITVILSVLILTMTVLLGDRRVKNELIRRFHL